MISHRCRIGGPFFMIPMGLAAYIQAKVTWERYDGFFNEPQLPRQQRTNHRRLPDDTRVLIESGTFNWREDGSMESPTLAGINFVAKAGQLVAVVGGVGSGKTSLCHAILEELVRHKGTVDVVGSVAFVPQTPFTLNNTLRENILFGKAWDPEKYRKTLRSCCLEQDLDSIPGGDLAEIGERGINLSGGQKMRVAIARAVYAECDTIILDDPLAAVDSHVAASLFYDLFVDKLKDKTIVLVTNQVQYLRDTAKVAVMEDGRIVEQGVYEELVARGGKFTELVASSEGEVGGASKEATAPGTATVETAAVVVHKQETKKPVAEKKELDLSAEGDKKKRKGGKLNKKEKVVVGTTAWHVYQDFFRAGGNGKYGTVIFASIVYFFSGVFELSADAWLAIWSNQANYNSSDPDDPNADAWMNMGDQTIGFYLGIYAGCAFLFYFFVSWRSYLMVNIQINASRYFHSKMLKSTLRATMSFFETTPGGQILNRFTRDIYELDFRVMDLWNFAALSSLKVTLNLLYITVVINLFGAFFAVIIVMYILVFEYYRRTARQLQRIEAVTRSPVYNHASEMLGGLESIRAYGEQKQYIAEHEQRLTNSARVYFAQKGMESWVGTWLGFIGSVIILCTALLLAIDPDSIEGGLAGMALSYALSTVMMLNVAVRYASELEAKMNCVERISEYCDLSPEAPKQARLGAPVGWPSKGGVEFKDVDFRYRKDLPLVLRGTNFKVEGGFKVGITGRTGGGKSTILSALFRLVEVAGGQILIDGIDISGLELDELRSKITIIPQDTTLFEGTVRYNLDPFHRFQDAELWAALEETEMKEAVEALELDGVKTGLAHHVEERGTNFSAGERQLICMARAILRKTRVLVMDEATASIDAQTDAKIQKMIRKSFKDCTLLIIAHRLVTIIDADLIICMDQFSDEEGNPMGGHVAEAGTPAELLANPDGVFASLVNETGEASATFLNGVASGEIVLDKEDDIMQAFETQMSTAAASTSSPIVRTESDIAYMAVGEPDEEVVPASRSVSA
jgi:ABC-type multidrug transport system fused ATPase/permease subunit